jgi:hypothetical protein
MDLTDQKVSADEIVSTAIAGDEPAFAALTERHRRELHVHCYRMLASRARVRTPGAQNMTDTSDSERTTVVPGAGTFPSSSPRAICTAVIPKAAAPAQYDG